jgi:hypothetical protein
LQLQESSAHAFWRQPVPELAILYREEDFAQLLLEFVVEVQSKIDCQLVF